MPDITSRKPLALAVLISGGGTTLRNLIERITAQTLHAEIRVVVSSSAAARGLQIASQSGIPTAVIERSQFGDVPGFSEAIFNRCRQAAVDLVVCGGFLKLLEIPPDFEQRVVNVHPSLIPAFCGHGFYGHRVHQAVLDLGAKVSGCTVHFVDNQYDHGPIILQCTVPVLDDDTAETLAKRVFAMECDAYPQALGLYAAGCLKVVGRRVRIAAEPGK